MADFDVNIILRAQDEARGVIRGLVGETKKLGGALGGVGGGRGRAQQGFWRDNFDFDANHVARSLAGAGANIDLLTGKVRRSLSAPLEMSANFEQAMAEVRAVTTDAQLGNNFDLLSETARQLGRDTEFTAEEVAGGLKFMGVAGLETQEQLAGIGPLLDVATISGEDLATTSDLLTDVMGGFGRSTDEMRSAADSMIATTLNANTSFAQLSRGMFKVGPLAKKAGVEFNEVSALLGTLANAGIKGAEGGTALRNILLSLTGKPSKDMRKLLKTMGLDAKQLRESIGKNGIAGTMGVLMEQMQHMSPEMQLFASNVLFGRRTAVSATNVLDKLNTEYADLKTKLDDSAGASTEAAAAMRDTAKTAGKTLKSAIADLGIEVGDHLMPLMLPLIEDAKSAVKWFSEWAKENPALVRTLGKMALSAIALGTVLGPLLLTLSSIVSIATFGRTAMLLLGGATKASGAAAAGGAVGWKAFWAAFMGPAGLIGIAMAAAAAAWVIIDTTQNKIDQLHDRAKKLQEDVAGSTEASVKEARSDDELREFIANREKSIKVLEAEAAKEGGVIDSLFNRGRNVHVEGIEAQRAAIREARSELIRRDAERFKAGEEIAASPALPPGKLAKTTAEIERRIDREDAAPVRAEGEIKVVVEDHRTKVTKTKGGGDIPVSVESGLAVGGL